MPRSPPRQPRSILAARGQNRLGTGRIRLPGRPGVFEKLTAAVGDAHTYGSLPKVDLYLSAISYFGDTPRVIRTAPLSATPWGPSHESR